MIFLCSCLIRCSAAVYALLDEFTKEIAAYVEAGMRKMGMKPEEEIVLAGSVFKGEDNQLTERVCRESAAALGLLRS